MEIKAQIVDIGRSYQTSRARITIETDDLSVGQSCKKFTGKDLTVAFKQYRKKRSLDANAYAWVLMDKLSASLNVPKKELYRGYIRNIGGNNEVVCVKTEAVQSICSGWSHNGIGWQTETFESKLEGCTNITLYQGSSTYDTEQMSRLIDLIVQDCMAVGIETKTPNELAELKALWETEQLKA